MTDLGGLDEVETFATPDVGLAPLQASDFVSRIVSDGDFHDFLHEIMTCFVPFRRTFNRRNSSLSFFG